VNWYIPKETVGKHSTFWVKRSLLLTLYIAMAETSTEMRRSPKCRDHQVLYGRLRADTKVYSDVTRRLESCKPEDFEQIYQAAESARIAFLKAREALSAHVIAHGCER
jgi:hypothetical protein